MSKVYKVKDDNYTRVIKIISYTFISFLALLALLPFLLVLGTSFSNEKMVLLHGFSIIPRQFSIVGYKIVFQNFGVVAGSYVVTILMTTIGTSLGLFIISMTGYVLQREDFEFRNKISFYIYFTTLFSGGMVPFYLLIVKYMGLKNNYLAILLPLLVSPWLIILMKNFMKSIPFAITESAKIDGANDFIIFLKIILPMSKPALATVGLFLALSYWNEWYNSMLFLESNVKYRPIQLFLYNVVNGAKYLRDSAAASNVPRQDIPLETMKMATAVIAIGPIMFLYPFVQKYFIKGITVGSVKG